MGRGFGAIYITKKCNCEMHNWVKYKTKNSSTRPDSYYLISCKKCDSQWYSRAKYVEKIPFAKY